MTLFPVRRRSREASNSRPALAVPNQLGEDDFHLPLGLHLLIVGTTGSGKTTLLSNILLAFDEFLREGSVRLLAIDLKDGVSATACAGFYTKIASTLPEAVDLLQETVELVKKRNAWLKSRHETEIRWSMQTPLIVILIDEALQLYGAASPEQKKLQAQAQEALDALLLTGRSAGIMVIAAVQDPRKEFFQIPRPLPRAYGPSSQFEGRGENGARGRSCLPRCRPMAHLAFNTRSRMVLRRSRA